MSEHTPGPWEIVGSCVRDSSKHLIAEISVHWGPSQWADNLRLIAAAPDMLEVLRAVAKHFADTDAPLGSAARALIARVSQPDGDRNV